MSEEHLGLDELAEDQESLLAPDRAAAVRAHLTQCPDCRARQQSLAEVRRELHAAPRLTMPSEVSARLDEALAAAVPTRPTGTAATLVPTQAPRRRPRRGPALAAAAAVVVVAGLVSALFVGHDRHTANPSAGAASGATNAAPAPTGASPALHYVVYETGTTYTTTSLKAGVLALANGTAPTPAATPTPTPSGTAAQDRADAARAKAKVIASAHHQLDELRHLVDSPKALQNCIDAVAEPTSQPVAVDVARWSDGPYVAAPSLVIVTEARPGVEAAYVTGPTCSGAQQVRYYTEVPAGG